jgi:hypothetical protein
LAKSTGSHCRGTAMGWLASANLLGALYLVMCGVKAAWKAAAMPMSTSARKPGASFFAESWGAGMGHAGWAHRAGGAGWHGGAG